MKNNNYCNVKIELCKKGAVIPKYANEFDAGMDIYAIDDVIIKPGETIIIPTGIKLAMYEGLEAQVRPRSGLSANTRLRISNTPGTIDQNFIDEIGIIIENTSIDYLEIAKQLQLDNIDDEKIKQCQKIYSINNRKSNFKKNANGSYLIEKGDRIAQLVFNRVEHIELELVEDVKQYALGDRKGGFGSTGIK